jgi:hypothetical protein
MDQRELIKTLYPNETWAKKVDMMTDDQVTAILLRARRDGKL